MELSGGTFGDNSSGRRTVISATADKRKKTRERDRFAKRMSNFGKTESFLKVTLF